MHTEPRVARFFCLQVDRRGPVIVDVITLGDWMVLAIIAILLGGFIAAMNWYAPIQSKLESRSVSMPPFIGAAMMGFGIYHLTDSIRWSLLAIPLDLGTLLFLIGLPWLIAESLKTAQYNEVVTFYSDDRGRELFITLYRNGVASIRQDYNGTVGPQEQGAIPGSRGFNARWEQNGDVFSLTDITGGREMVLTPDEGGFLSSESKVEPEAKPHTLMDNLRFTQTKNNTA
jgi:hypothetical protein